MFQTRIFITCMYAHLLYFYWMLQFLPILISQKHWFQIEICMVFLFCFYIQICISTIKFMSTINDQYNDILKTEYFVAGKRIQNLWVVQVFPCLYSEDKSCQGFPEIQHTCSAPSSTDSKSWWRNPPPVDKQNQIHWLILQKQQNNSLQEKNWTVVLKQPSYVDPVSRTHEKIFIGMAPASNYLSEILS